MTEPRSVPRSLMATQKVDSSKIERLSYSIHSCSGYTSTFQPHHILVDNPLDQSSRWTALNTKQHSNLNLSMNTDPAPSSTGATPSSAVPATTTPTNPRISNKRSRDIQYIILELDRPAIVTSIGFGKYNKVHPCNLHEFSVYGGMSPDLHCMEPLLHSGLKNDSNPELFALPTDAASPKGKPSALLPSKFIRIDALTPHTQNYNVSIWHVWLLGITSGVNSALIAYDEYRSATTTHLILSHLRRSSLLPTFHSLLSSIPTSVSSTFEHSLLSKLHETLVVRGNFIFAENVLEQCQNEGLFNEWTGDGGKGVSIARWEELSSSHNNGGGGGGVVGPKARAGHGLVRTGRKLFLFGGFDGKKDLGDCWEYDLPRRDEGDISDTIGWKCLDEGKEDQLRIKPRARSCHQMAVDEKEGYVYLLGARVSREEEEAFNHSKDLDGEENGAAQEMDVEGVSARESEGKENIYASDFWRYKFVGAGRGNWELLSRDTGLESGPKLLFDHQMIVHSDTQRLFVFGGRIQPPDNEDSLEDRYSGMFCYDIASRTWSHLFGDPTSNDTFRAERLLGRIGHSMIFDAHSQNLFVFGGQRGDAYLADLWAIKLASPDSSEQEDQDEAGDLIHAHASPSGSSSLWRAGAVIGTGPLSPSSPSAITTVTSSTISSWSASARSPTILQIQQLSEDVSSPSTSNTKPGPSPSFTHRTTIDPETREWTVVSGLVKYRQARKEAPSNEVWIRSKRGKWEHVEAKGPVPEPRFAAQVVHDPLRRESYLFGGNPHKGTEERLGDFWKLKVVHPSPEEALRMARFLIRKQRFTEMCRTRPTLTALRYLQTSVGSVVDHTDEGEASAFRACMLSVLSAPARNNCDPNDDEDVAGEGASPGTTESISEMEDVVEGGEVYKQRHDLFESLLAFFPLKDCQPLVDLMDVASQLRRDKL